MDEFGILRDLIVVFVVAAGVIYGFHRLRLPTVVGLLVAGVVVGPSGLAVIGEVEQVRLLAEVGVVVLLFAVGLEFSFSRLLAMWRPMLAVGLPQVALCVLAAALATLGPMGAAGPAIFVGMLVALSSTAVVIRSLSDRGELGAPQGRLAVAVLLLQDLLVTLFMIAVPLLAARGGDGASVGRSLAVGMGVVAVVLLGSRFVVTPALGRVVRTRNRELFLIFIALVCLGTAMLTAWAGLSLALGAFLAGLVLSESEYAHQMFSEVVPFRDTLSSLFFVSVGMLLDLRFVAANLPLVALAVAGVVVLKFLAGAVPTYLAGYPRRIAVLVGVALAQVGEFSFVLANRGQELGLLSGPRYQAFLAAAVLTMVLTPFAIDLGPRLAGLLAAISWPRRREATRDPSDEPDDGPSREDHVIIVGYGLAGRNLARVLRSTGIPYVVLELNPEAVRRSQGEGEPIHFGDATRPTILEHLGIARARVLVLAISDPAATRRAVQIARRLNPRLHIVARTRFLSEIDELTTLGADEIIPDDFVTSVELFARVLREYQVPRNRIIDLIDLVRRDQYEALRGLRPARLNQLHEELAAGAEVETCRVTDGSPAVGPSLGELGLRSRTGASLLAVRREGSLETNPDASFRLQAGDVAILFGSRAQVDAASALLDPGSFGPPPPGAS